MKRLIGMNLKRNVFTNILFVLALFFIFIVIPLAASSLQQVHRQVQTDVTYYARGSYDILVRTVDNKHPLEEELGVVPENYIGFGNGGISLDDLEQLKAREDLEIVAPVASLGYFTGITSNVGYERPEESTRYTVQYYTSDGIHKYKVGEEKQCILLKDETLGAALDGMFEGRQFQPMIADMEMLNYCEEVAMFETPPTYHLLVGIDPEEEEKLTGIPYAFHRTGWGATYRSDAGNTDAAIVPLLELEHEQQGIQLDIVAEIDRLAVRAPEMDSYKERLGMMDDPDSDPFLLYEYYTDEYQELMKELLAMPADEQLELKIDLASHLNLFFHEGLLLYEDGSTKYLLENADQLEGYNLFEDVDLSNATKYYTADYVNYEQRGEQLAIRQVSEMNGIPIYRDLEERGVSFSDMGEDEHQEFINFYPDPIGTVPVKGHEEQLASSPLGIYQFAPVYYIGDENEERVELYPTITPGSFVSVPAKAVTNMESAAVVKGDKPIDAIRIKVAGIDGYTKEAAQKLEGIVADIEAMGLQATIIAGSSPQKIEVDVEEIGLVEESWTTLGAAGTIISEWNVTNVLLAILFGFASIIYIVNRQLFWQVNKENDILLLNQLGWKKKHIQDFSRKELLLLIGITCLVSVPALYGINLWTAFANDIFVWQLLGMLIAAMVILLLVGRKVNQLLKTSSMGIKGIKQSRNLRGKSLIWKNIQYFRPFIRSPFFQLLAVSTLSSFVYLSLAETVQETNLTMLGEYINVQTSEWHVILIGAAYLLAFFTLVESLLSLLKVREKEIGNFLRIGWKFKHIRRLYMSEIAIWSGISIGLGTIVSGVVFGLMYAFEWNVLLSLALSFIGFYLMVLLLSFFMIQRKLKQSA